MSEQQNENNDSKRDEGKSAFKSRQRLALWTGIPMTMLSGLIVGYLIGIGLEKKFQTDGVLLGVSVILGVAAGFKLVFEQIKKLE